MEILSSLNPQQVEAVKATEGPLLILAGAGSGKTRVITVRIAYLISEKKVEPRNILAVTFTNKAAGEMRARVEELLKGQTLRSFPLISTFHSLCVRILRQDIEQLNEGYKKTFTIYDTDDSQKVVKACIKDLGLDEKQVVPRAVRNAISAAKNRGEDVELFTSRIETTDDKRAATAKIFRMYEDRLRLANALDFDDLLIKTVRLLRTSAEVRAKYNDRYTYVLVDEYQDTNSLQFAMINFLTEKQQNICVVGDDAQSIYGFRQADIKNILDFELHFPDAKTILLEQNYRSTQTILDVAHAIIENNINQKKKKLWTANEGGDRIYYYQAPDSDGEGRFVASKIEEHKRRNPDVRVAVLYRTNAQSRVFEEALRRLRIDYNIVGGFSFYERAEVKDVISYLKLALNPADDVALLRVINTPPRGLGKTSMDELLFRAKDLGVSLWETIAIITEPTSGVRSALTPRAKDALRSFKKVIEKLQTVAGEVEGTDRKVSDVVIAAIDDTGYSLMLRSENTDEAEARLENLEELVNASVDYDKSDDMGIRDFIDHAALTADTDKFDRNAGVTLMTVHSAKGLEFPIVFLVGLEDGIFPHSRSLSDEKEMEEERRLAYVAITRAEKILYVTHSMRRRVYGEETAAEPSQFLNEMPLELIDDLSYGSSWLSFARGSAATANRAAASALRGERPAFNKPKNLYTGKTYNSTEAIAEFFKNKGGAPKGSGDSGVRPGSGSDPGSSDGPRPAGEPPKKPSGFDKLRAQATPKKEIENRKSQIENPKGFVAGSHVKHDKYGKGLVLRREGSGDNVKLTISFPGYGQKKLIEKYANLEQA
ncbi:MAG TPA: UvrD-helicase domain-containing protein [Pyrinomonadaceae bacterium]|nr:UvrD-helicase domain-containing protein [Pyrinomonadaceae bacterium]